MSKNSHQQHSDASVCYHCGTTCEENTVHFDEKDFCCTGCQTVYEILSQNDLCDYYRLEDMPGITPKVASQSRFAYLDHEQLIDQLLDYQDEKIAKIQLYLPQIHCSSCLWLLENLPRLLPAVLESRVNFLKKTVSITYQHADFSLRTLVESLASLGYEPEINLDQLSADKPASIRRKLVYQIGLAGFAFGNIMLFSLPDYFGLDSDSYRQFAPWFTWINLLLATPVAFYSGQDYFKSAWRSLRQKRLNIDVPIALGILVLYLRSSYEVVSATGAGYFDSLCGLLFFLLLGRIFQEKTYHHLSFERDYRSYFPISVCRVKDGIEAMIPVNEVQKGDQLRIRNGELIPVDATLLAGDARIDNSFATGESAPVPKKKGDRIYAGGRQQGEAIIVETIRPLAQSKLTALWNEQASKHQQHSHFSHLTDQISQWFTPIILLIAMVAGIWHGQEAGIGQAIEVFSAVLIVACPCALALAAPFTFGHAMRWLGRQQCYLRDAHVIEVMASIQHLVFDKTGTLTHSKHRKVEYQGISLNEEEEQELRTLLVQSNHPLSRLIAGRFREYALSPLQGFQELEGKGLSASINNKQYRLGSPDWLGYPSPMVKETMVMLEIDQELKGFYSIRNRYRSGLGVLIDQLKNHFNMSLLSGDNDGQKQILKSYFPEGSSLHFYQSPEDKLKHIAKLQRQGEKVMMVGDGLNDAAAFRQSDIGLALSEDINTFSPACDIILEANQFSKLHRFLQFARQSKRVVIISYVLSFLYNLVGLSFAVQGQLSPVAAAILMPLSSISVVGFVTLAIYWLSNREKLLSVSIFNKEIETQVFANQ